MKGEMELLPPVTRRSGHRLRGLGVSAGVHFVILVLLGLPSRTPVPPQVPAEDGPEVVWIAPPPEPERQQPPPQVLAKAAEPTRYEAAQAVGDKERAKNADDQGRNADGSSWRNFLPRALAMQTEGVRAPAYVITNLDATLVANLTSRGLALLVAGQPPFRDDPRQVLWAAGGPVGLTALPPSWAQESSRRGLPLPRSWIDGVALAPAVGVYLVPRAALDAAILAAQLEAAERRGVPLQGLARTYGRVVPDHDGALAYMIDRVDLVPHATAQTPS